MMAHKYFVPTMVDVHNTDKSEQEHNVHKSQVVQNSDLISQSHLQSKSSTNHPEQLNEEIGLPVDMRHSSALMTMPNVGTQLPEQPSMPEQFPLVGVPVGPLSPVFVSDDVSKHFVSTRSKREVRPPKWYIPELGQWK